MLRNAKVAIFRKKITYMKKLMLSLTMLFFIMPMLAKSQQKHHTGKTDKEANDQENKKDHKPSDTTWTPTAVTRHSVSVDGQTIDYTATAGYLDMKDNKGKSVAHMFFIAYTKDGVTDKHKRPVTFAFNGGPGSASVWLHMGAVGPRRVELNDKGVSPAPPYHLVNNGNTWLDQTDLVFIDAMSTGYSRADKGEDPNQFHGYVNDIKSVGNFIRLYTTQYDRWNSPKFILGESYGTTRAAGLSGYLQDNYNMYLNGIILVSSVLNFQTISFSAGNDQPYIFFLPTYATTAWYHKMLDAQLQNKTVEQIASQVKHFAEGAYAHALFEGNTITEQDKNRIIDSLHRYTSLPVAYLRRANMRVPAFRFFKMLLRDSAKVIGRYDSRFTGEDIDPLSGTMQYDPSNANISGSFVGAFNAYIRDELKFKTDVDYKAMANVWPWDYAKNQYLNVAPTLHEAMTKNKYLHTWVVCGYYDMATPFAAAEYVVDHMGLTPKQSQRTQLTFYKAGHMVYISKNTIAKLHQDAVRFYGKVLPKPSITH
jgi:carboxypeptidase C (cathepsin A)